MNEPEPYDNRAVACLCPECWNDADWDSELCANCSWFGCTNERSKCDAPYA